MGTGKGGGIEVGVAVKGVFAAVTQGISGSSQSPFTLRTGKAPLAKVRLLLQSPPPPSTLSSAWRNLLFLRLLESWGPKMAHRLRESCSRLRCGQSDKGK